MRSLLKKVVPFLLFLAVSILLRRASLSPTYVDHKLAPATDATKVRVTWLGVATILFDDGDTQLLVDAYFTRPGFFETIWGTPLNSDLALVRRSLERAGVREGALKAVIPVHSHIDHAVDVGAVSEITGATVVGDSSTANIALGFGVSPSKIHVIPREAERTRLTFGDFAVTLIRSVHSAGGLFTGEIESPIEFPAPASAFRMGECYSILIEHPGGSMLVHGSANYLPGMMKDVHADVVFLATAGLSGILDGDKGAERRFGYWDELVRSTGAKRIVPIHWEDFWAPVDAELISMPYALDNFPRTASFIAKRAQVDKISIAAAEMYVAADPLADPIPY